MGHDGLRGSELVHDLGGTVIAQDEATSVVWGMPGFVAKAGIAQAVLPLAAIATAITSRVLPASAPPRPLAPPAAAGAVWR
jgi:two-component system chemotaxis response regulator CheB